ncbi:FkbM family methyltransferase [Burkholderia multivorans]|uniref:FkbM family methyltransferase n=1 Tax=Burkholderia multivorans TaxID=87883 RepID=UPI001C24D7F9|nr:FkbM family methyltransferase [Burkholderia multivorans]MBU9618063.1 FkbM family methyltransferase [Burkholderia multivorans]
MSVSNITPFRQLSRAYSALLQISAKLDVMTETRRDLLADASETRRALNGIEDAVRTLTPPEPVVLEVPAPPRPVDVHERMGFNLLLDDSSLVDRTMIQHGTWEPEQLAYMAELTDRFRKFERPIFLDIGSYWGLYSLLALRSGIFAEQIAFEADRTNFAQLQANLFLNRATGKIRTINKAVSDRVTTLKFRDSTTHPEGNRAGASVLGWNEDYVGYPVEAVPIDSIVQDSGRFILMKLDVEGHESQVLRGMERTIANNKVVMQVEIFEQHHDTVFAEVDRLGLRVIHKIYPDCYVTNMSVEELGV